MALYKVTEKGVDKPRAVEAKSKEAAIQHVTEGRFDAVTITSAAEGFALAKDGIVIEQAGVQPASDPKPPEGVPGEVDKDAGK